MFNSDAGEEYVMRIAVCDDNAADREKFAKTLKECAPTLDAEQFADGASFLEAAKKMPPFDAVFLDIYMPGTNGVDIAKTLKEISPETGLVFVTTSREHAVEAFSLYAMHYLVKPVTAQGIQQALSRLTELRHSHRDSITLTVGRERHIVFLDQICILESDNHTVNVSLSDGRRLKVRMQFGEMERMMNKKFLRINRGIMVNMDYIMRMGADTCVMQNGIRLPITIRQSAAIRASYDDYVFDRLAGRKGF